MAIRLTLDIEAYHCDPCSKKQGTVVRELVRMIPRAGVIAGRLVGDEFWCCPICFEPKFDVKGKRKVDASGRSRRKPRADVIPGPGYDPAKGRQGHALRLCAGDVD